LRDDIRPSQDIANSNEDYNEAHVVSLDLTAISTNPDYGPRNAGRVNPIENQRQMVTTINNTCKDSNLAKILCIDLKKLQAIDDKTIPISPLDTLYHLVYDILHIFNE
jgi:hypothetical protein